MSPYLVAEVVGARQAPLSRREQRRFRIEQVVAGDAEERVRRPCAGLHVLVEPLAVLLDVVLAPIRLDAEGRREAQAAAEVAVERRRPEPDLRRELRIAEPRRLAVLDLVADALVERALRERHARDEQRAAAERVRADRRVAIFDDRVLLLGRTLRLREPIEVEREPEAGLGRDVLAERVERRVAAAADRAGLGPRYGQCKSEPEGGAEDDLRRTNDDGHQAKTPNGDAKFSHSAVARRLRQNVAARRCSARARPTGRRGGGAH